MIDLQSLLAIGLVTGSITITGLIIGVYSLKSRIESRIIGTIEQFLVGFLGQIAENPKQFADMVKPILSSLVKELMPPEMQKAADSMGSEGMGLALNFLPKKYRGIAGILMQFMGNGSADGILPKSGTGTASNANKSPFS